MPELKIFGRKPVFEALEANLPIKKIFLAAGAEGKAIAKIQALVTKQKIHCTILNRTDFQRLAGPENHQGIVAVMDALPTLSLQALLDNVVSKSAPVLALLDSVEDPRNLGAILRVADGAGVDGVIIPQRRSASLTPGAIKTSAGAAFHVPVAEVTNLSRAIEALKKNRFWIAGMDMAGDKRPWEIDFNLPVAIVLGSESKGMRRLIREKCDFLVSLPMHGKVESLNVSTAAAAIFYEIVRQRREI